MRKIIALCFVALALNGAAYAQSTALWSVDRSVQGYQIAKVSNALGNTTGLICDLSDGCYAYLNPDVTCQEGAVTPLIVHSAVGAYPLIGRCLKFDEGVYLLTIDEFDAMVEAFQSGGEIGFAMPMAQGQFKVVRFSTAGATAAINAARTPPSNPVNKRTRASELL